MHLHDSAEKLAKRVHLLDPAADLQLVREIVELHEAKCTRCQEDRLSCTVRPSCKDRNFLNALIEVGINPSVDLDFCYSQHLNQLRRFVLEGKGRQMFDRRVPIRDLLSSFKFSSIRQFTTQMTKRWRRHARIRHGDLLLIGGDDILFHFDFSRGIVEVNPWDVEVRDYVLFDQYVRLLSSLYGIEAESFDATLNWWILSINLGPTGGPIADEVLAHEVVSEFEAVHKTADEDSVVLQAEVVLREESRSIRVGAIRTLFALLANSGG